MKEELPHDQYQNNGESLPIAEIQEDGPEAAAAMEILGRSIEVSPTLDGDIAVCLIKPDAYRDRAAIIARLEESGLYVVSRKARKLSEGLIERLYASEGVPAPIMDATQKHFASGSSEIVIVKGADAIKRLLTTAGLETNPALCDAASIRHMFGKHVPEELGQGLKYYQNALHRPKNIAENESNLQTLREAS